MGFLKKLAAGASKIFKGKPAVIPPAKKQGTSSQDAPPDWSFQVSTNKAHKDITDLWDRYDESQRWSPWQDLVSSNVSAVRYRGDGTFQIRFHSGAVYEYDGVPIEIYRLFLTTHSPGQAVWYTVRDRFPYRKIGQETATAPAADRFSGKPFAVPDDVQAAMKRAGVQEPQGGMWNHGTPTSTGVEEPPLPWR